MATFFKEFTRFHMPWMQELADKYKEKGTFGIYLFTLADYYTEPKDQELATFASLLISDNDSIRRQIKALRTLLTDSPSEWYSKRKFVNLSIGRKQNKVIKGSKIPYWEVAALFNRIWDIEHPNPDDIKYYGNDIESEVYKIKQSLGCDAFHALSYLLDGVIDVKDIEWKLRVALIRLCRKDGIGLGLWGYGDEPLTFPFEKKMRTFIKTWMPDYRKYGDIEECVSLFELRDSVDFWYAFHGYKELQKKHPKECRRYATRYMKWYESGAKYKPYVWRDYLPKIDF